MVNVIMDDSFLEKKQIFNRYAKFIQNIDEFFIHKVSISIKCWNDIKKYLYEKIKNDVDTLFLGKKISEETLLDLYYLLDTIKNTIKTFTFYIDFNFKLNEENLINNELSIELDIDYLGNNLKE